MEKSLTIAQYIGQDTVRKSIVQVLKDKAPQFMASVTSLVNSNESLRECDQGSVLRACLTASSLDLPINQNLGFAYVIAYRNNKTGKTEAQYQMGYKGYIQLAQRSGQVKTINVTDVKEGEIAENNLATGEIVFKWMDNDRDKAKTIGFVAYIKLINGFEKQLYMTVEQLKAHGVRFSKTYKKGFGLWKDDFDAMAKKTVMKMLLSKYAPMTVEMQKAQLADQAIVRENGTYEYVDNDTIEDKKREMIDSLKAKKEENLEQPEEAQNDEPVGDDDTAIDNVLANREGE